MKAYVYDIDSKIVIAKIIGDTNEVIEAVYKDKIGDQDELAMAYSPNELIDNKGTTTYFA